MLSMYLVVCIPNTKPNVYVCRFVETSPVQMPHVEVVQLCARVSTIARHGDVCTGDKLEARGAVRSFLQLGPRDRKLKALKQCKCIPEVALVFVENENERTARSGGHDAARDRFLRGHVQQVSHCCSAHSAPLWWSVVISAHIFAAAYSRRSTLPFTVHLTRMTETCFKKCVPRFHDKELNTGENVCADRCVGKYVNVRC